MPGLPAVATLAPAMVVVATYYNRPAHSRRIIRSSDSRPADSPKRAVERADRGRFY